MGWRQRSRNERQLYARVRSLMRSRRLPAQGRLETSLLSLVHGLIGRLGTALGHSLGAGAQALDNARGGLANEADAVFDRLCLASAPPRLLLR